jgi:hypothetical protein
MSDPASLAKLAAWLQKRLDDLPPNASLTVTWRRDRSGRLLREYEVKEGRVLTPEEIRAQT